MAEFYSWIKDKIKQDKPTSPDDANSQYLKNGILYLKGGDLKEELSEAKIRYKVYELSDFFKEDFFETKKVVYVPGQGKK